MVSEHNWPKLNRPQREALALAELEVRKSVTRYSKALERHAAKEGSALDATGKAMERSMRGAHQLADLLREWNRASRESPKEDVETEIGS